LASHAADSTQGPLDPQRNHASSAPNHNPKPHHQTTKPDHQKHQRNHPKAVRTQNLLAENNSPVSLTRQTEGRGQKQYNHAGEPDSPSPQPHHTQPRTARSPARVSKRNISAPNSTGTHRVAHGTARSPTSGRKISPDAQQPNARTPRRPSILNSRGFPSLRPLANSAGNKKIQRPLSRAAGGKSTSWRSESTSPLEIMRTKPDFTARPARPPPKTDLRKRRSHECRRQPFAHKISMPMVFQHSRAGSTPPRTRPPQLQLVSPHKPVQEGPVSSQFRKPNPTNNSAFTTTKVFTLMALRRRRKANGVLFSDDLARAKNWPRRECSSY